MSWHKATFPSVTDDIPEVLQIGQLAGEGFFRANKPQGFGMFHAKRGIPNQPGSTLIVYLSPVASETCPEIFESFKFEPCEAPARNEQDIAFVIGDPWTMSLLQEWFGGERPLILTDEERAALEQEKAQTEEVAQARTEETPQAQAAS